MPVKTAKYLTAAELPPDHPNGQEKTLHFRQVITDTIRAWTKFNFFVRGLARETGIFGFSFCWFPDEYDWRPTLIRMDKGRFCRRYSSHAFQATARTETPPWKGTASCGFTLVVFEEAPEPFATLYWAFPLWGWADHRKEEHVVLALMIPLVMKMWHILRQRMAE